MMHLDTLIVLLVALIAIYYQIDFRILWNATFLAQHKGFVAAFKYYIRHME